MKRMFDVTRAALSDDAAALNDSQQDNDDGHHEQDVDEAPDGVAGHETEKPQDDQNDSDGLEHGMECFRVN